MQGLMMNRPLSIIDILKYAAENHPDAGITSVRTEGDIHHYSYRESFERVAQLAHALRLLGVKPGDRVATLAWNGYRHFELYYAISGIGAICHTINPRLSAEQLVYIVNHASDELIFVDTTFVPALAALKEHFPEKTRIVVMTDHDHMPQTPLEVLCYENILDGQSTSFDWPELDENTGASMCYTSGTTGHPKGALYSHRSSVLHAFLVALAMGPKLPQGHKVLPVVPQFHVNAWGLPYVAPLMGVTLVMPGHGLDGPSLFKLMDDEKVFSAWGVPTVWLGLLNEIKAQGRIPEGFGDVVIGGSAAPRSMIKAFEELGVHVNHAWGMTEMSPLGTHGVVPQKVLDMPLEERLDYKQKQGRRAFGVELKIVDEHGQRLPHDGKAAGELFVRGNSIISAYYNNEEASAKAFDAEGWFGTGDVATIDAGGYLAIQDRAKDLIKSGGEWISSIDLENAAMSHPAIANCAAIGVPHPKWDERPILVAIQAPDTKTPSLDEIRGHMEEHFAKWQLPDDVVWVETLPMTATGKVSKLTLRQQLGDYKHPELR